MARLWARLIAWTVPSVPSVASDQHGRLAAGGDPGDGREAVGARLDVENWPTAAPVTASNARTFGPIPTRTTCSAPFLASETPPTPVVEAGSGIDCSCAPVTASNRIRALAVGVISVDLGVCPAAACSRSARR